MMDRGYQHNLKEKLQPEINEPHMETEVRPPETKQQGRKGNVKVAFRDAIPALIVYCKRSFNGKVESHTNSTATLLIFKRTTPYFLQERKTMAKNMLVRAKILKVNTRFHAGIDVQPVTPCSFSPKIIYVSKRLEWAFPSVSN